MLRKLIGISLTISCFGLASIGKASDVASEIKAPTDQETCFSPDEPCAFKLLKFIASAEKSIDLAVFDINLVDIVKVLIEKSKVIPVRIVADTRQAHGTYSQSKSLLRAGVRLKYGAQKGVMHNKFVIIDGKMMETGSFNFTNHAGLANQENQIYLSNPTIIKRFSERFEKIWAGAKEPKKEERDQEEEESLLSFRDLNELFSDACYRSRLQEFDELYPAAL